MRYYLLALSLLLVSSTQCIIAQWNNQNGGTSVNLHDVVMIDSLSAVCVGDGELILRTSDGGISWTSVFSGASNKGLHAVSFFNKTIGFVGGDAGVYYTGDGGLTWTKRSTGITTDIWNIKCVDSSTVVAVGSSGYQMIYRSTDAGQSWTTKDSLSVGIYGGFISLAFKGNFGLTGGGNGSGYIYSSFWAFTSDGGKTWAFNDRGFGPISPDKIVIMDTSNIYAIGNANSWKFESMLLFSSDKGVTWTEKHMLSGTAQQYTFLYFIDQFKGFLGDNSGDFFETKDGGTTWDTIQGFANGNIINGMSFSDSKNGILVGNSGLIMRTMIGGITAVNSTNVQLPEKIQLFHNYPNPFNPSTTISFFVPSPSIISLEVLDIMGRHIETLIAGYLETGLYKIRWAPSKLSMECTSVAYNPIILRKPKNSFY